MYNYVGHGIYLQCWLIVIYSHQRVSPRKLFFFLIFLNKIVLHNEFKTKQKSFDKAFRRAKRAFLRKNEIKLESMVTNNGKDMWKKVEQLGAKGKSQCIVPSEVIKNGKVCTDKTQVLKQWKDDFSSLYQGTTDNALGLDVAFLDTAKSELVQFDEIDLDQSKCKSVTESEALIMTKSIKNRKAVSTDKIPNEVLKNQASVDILCVLYNICLKKGKIPDI